MWLSLRLSECQRTPPEDGFLMGPTSLTSEVGARMNSGSGACKRAPRCAEGAFLLVSARTPQALDRRPRTWILAGLRAGR